MAGTISSVYLLTIVPTRMHEATHHRVHQNSYQKKTVQKKNPQYTHMLAKDSCTDSARAETIKGETMLKESIATYVTSNSRRLHVQEKYCVQ